MLLTEPAGESCSPAALSNISSGKLWRCWLSCNNIAISGWGQVSWGEGGNLRGGEWGLSGLLPRARALRDLATPISPRELVRGSCTARNFGSILFLKFLSTSSRHLTTLTDFYQYFMSYVHMKNQMFNTALDLIRAKSKIELLDSWTTQRTRS